MASHDDADDDYDDVPLHHKQPFGSGIRRQKVTFVRASTPELSSTAESLTAATGSSVRDLYLGLVLPTEAKEGPENKPSGGSADAPVCEICGLRLDEQPASGQENQADEAADASSAPRPESSRRHEASIAHQVCLAHSHPPSAVNRTRKGLAVLESYGWDPDSRRGLGPGGQGIRHPIKATVKEDTLGLGVVVPKDVREGRVSKPRSERMTAKQCRRAAEEEKKLGEKLRRQFYGSEDLEKYLGSG